MTGDALMADLDGVGATPLDQRLSLLRAEATRLVEEVVGPLKHVALRTGDCAVELTWADPPMMGSPPVVSTMVATDAVVSPPPVEGDTVAVAAPLVGVFYAAPSPGAPPFVHVGDRVAAGQTIGIIEAMKLMNKIAADAAGIVTEILAANGQQVEFGQELVRIRPDPDADV